MKGRGRNRRAFTLIEVLFVVIILAALAAVGFIGMRYYLTRAYDITVHQDLVSFAKAEEIYRAERGRYLGTEGDYMEGGEGEKGTLKREDLRYAPSAGVRITIVSGDGASPAGPPPFRAEATHPSASKVFVYDFSTGEMTKREKGS